MVKESSVKNHIGQQQHQQHDGYVENSVQKSSRDGNSSMIVTWKIQFKIILGQQQQHDSYVENSVQNHLGTATAT